MDMKEIEKKFIEIVNHNCLQCCVRINELLVIHYKEIRDKGQTQIDIDKLSPELFNSWFATELVEAIKKHYSKNWNITYCHGSEYVGSSFIFKYKSKTDISFKLEGTPQVEEETSRSELIDL